MRKTADVALGDVSTNDYPDFTEPLPEAEDFDVAEWLGGVRPTRRGVRLYARADVIARMEEIASLIEDLPEGDALDDLVEEFERLQRLFEASGRWFVVEGRSQEWVEDYRRVAKRDMGIKRDPSERQKMQIILGQLAEQIATPSGVTVEMLDRLNDSAPGELSKLIVAMTFANEQVAQSAGVLRLDFSSRRSGATPD